MENCIYLENTVVLDMLESDLRIRITKECVVCTSRDSDVV